MDSNNDEEWETEEEDMSSVSFDEKEEIGGSNIKSREELEKQGLVIFDTDGKSKVDATDAKILYLGVVYAPPPDITDCEKKMMEDATTRISDFAVISIKDNIFRALPVAREEETGNIDFYKLSPGLEVDKIHAECKAEGIKPAWVRWIGLAGKKKSPREGTATDTALFGEEEGCIYLSSALMMEKKSAQKKKSVKPRRVATEVVSSTETVSSHEKQPNEAPAEATTPSRRKRSAPKRTRETSDESAEKKAKSDEKTDDTVESVHTDIPTMSQVTSTSVLRNRADTSDKHVTITLTFDSMQAAYNTLFSHYK